MSISLIYDGTFDGFLTCIFNVYELKLTNVTIRKKENFTKSFFSTPEEIITNPQNAERVWKGIRKKAGSEGQALIYKSFLSEISDIEDALLHYIRLVFLNIKGAAKNYGDLQVLKLAKTVKMINREKHRMDAFIRFRLTKDAIYFATIEPDFNVLPLNLKHFKNRYADQKWLIYDLKRNYGIYYDLNKVEFIEIEIDENINTPDNNSHFFTPEEIDFQDLWKNYYKSTNIASRKNTRLHLRHVPKRYWKYLSEKEGLN